MLLNVRRDTYQTIVQTPISGLKNSRYLNMDLKNTSQVDEDLQYIVIIEDEVYQAFLDDPYSIESLRRMQQSFLENAVFKFSNAESTAKLLISEQVFTEAGL